MAAQQNAPFAMEQQPIQPLGELTQAFADFHASVNTLHTNLLVLCAKMRNDRVHIITDSITQTTGEPPLVVIYVYPVKEIPGNGTALSNALFAPDVEVLWESPPDGAPLLDFPPAVIAPEDPMRADLTLAQLRGLVAFYNNDFGIVAGDSDEEKFGKFRAWLASGLP